MQILKATRGDATWILWVLLSCQLSYGILRHSFPLNTRIGHRSAAPSHSFRFIRNLAGKDDQICPVVITSERQRYSQSMAKVFGFVVTPYLAMAVAQNASPSAASARESGPLRIPLFTYDGVFCMNYTVNGNHYRGIIDTGSPFLIVPSVNTTVWGYTNGNNPPYTDSGLSKTTEIFGGQDYETYWKVGDLELSKEYSLKKVIFANVGEDIMRPPGGVFVGLIKYKADDIRPTLLGQMKYSSIQFDSLNKELVLSKTPQIRSPESKAAAIKMVDLRVLGDPVYHYAAKIKRLEINGREIAGNSTIYAVFDTGTTGCVLSDDLMNDYETPNPIRNVRVILTGENGKDIVFETGATRDEIFVVTAAKIPWFTKESEALKNYFDDTTVERTTRSTEGINSAVRSDVYDTEQSEISTDDEDDAIMCANISRRLLKEPQVVVIGLSFFKNKVLTIDIDAGRLSLLPSVLR